MELGKRVVDKELIDQNGRRIGKVDDLLIALPDGLGGGRPPQVAAIVTGPMALSRHLPRWWGWLARRVYRLLGVPDPQPIAIPWSAVDHIDVTIHVGVDRYFIGATRVADAAAQRYVARVPGA